MTRTSVGGYMQNMWPWLAVLAAFAAAALLRYLLIEVYAIAFLCDAAVGAPWWCALRRVVVLSFNTQALGYFSLLTGVLAVVTRSRIAALAALQAGAAGLILYCWESSAVGFVLGGLTLLRVQACAWRPQDGSGQQCA